MAQRFTIINDHIRANALKAVQMAPEGYSIAISEPKRSNDQNAKFHAMLTDLSRSPIKWAGKRRSVDEWKIIMISGHSVTTGTGGEVIPGIEGEFVAIRESSASMTVRRAASLIEYLEAFCVSNDVELHETERCGFLSERTGAVSNSNGRAA
jgi:hypothetical protein